MALGTDQGRILGSVFASSGQHHKVFNGNKKYMDCALIKLHRERMGQNMVSDTLPDSVRSSSIRHHRHVWLMSIHSFLDQYYGRLISRHSSTF